MTIPAKWLKRYFYGRPAEHLFRYTVIGFCTTFISFSTFWLMIERGAINPNIANIVSVTCAVIFAYIANKNFVFKSKCESFMALTWEFVRFILSRTFVMAVEISGLFLLHNIILLEALTSKILVSVLVLLLNYLSSRLIVFNKSRL